MRSPYISDPDRYTRYYMNQAGTGLPGFSGSATQYGAGIGGIFRSLFRYALPLLKSGFNIAKPHIKNAGKSIAGDIVTRMIARATEPKQEGSGLMVYTRRGLKRPPQTRLQGSPHTRRKTVKSPHRGGKIPKAKKRKASVSHKRKLHKDIF